jgi:hypothetical protein
MGKAYTCEECYTATDSVKKTKVQSATLVLLKARVCFCTEVVWQQE